LQKKIETVTLTLKEFYRKSWYCKATLSPVKPIISILR